MGRSRRKGHRRIHNRDWLSEGRKKKEKRQRTRFYQTKEMKDKGRRAAKESGRFDLAL